jgi:hypothetical protein
MNLKGSSSSANFEDRTGWSPPRRKLHSVATLLNPALAASNLHDWMQARGLAPIKGVNLRKRGIADILKGG